jgi:hypothetical protein
MSLAKPQVKQISVSVLLFGLAVLTSEGVLPWILLIPTLINPIKFTKSFSQWKTFLKQNNKYFLLIFVYLLPYLAWQIIKRIAFGTLPSEYHSNLPALPFNFIDFVTHLMQLDVTNYHGTFFINQSIVPIILGIWCVILFLKLYLTQILTWAKTLNANLIRRQILIAMLMTLVYGMLNSQTARFSYIPASTWILVAYLVIFFTFAHCNTLKSKFWTSTLLILFFGFTIANLNSAIFLKEIHIQNSLYKKQIGEEIKKVFKAGPANATYIFDQVPYQKTFLVHSFTWFHFLAQKPAQVGIFNPQRDLSGNLVDSNLKNAKFYKWDEAQQGFVPK